MNFVDVFEDCANVFLGIWASIPPIFLAYASFCIFLFVLFSIVGNILSR